MKTNLVMFFVYLSFAFDEYMYVLQLPVSQVPLIFISYLIFIFISLPEQAWWTFF